MANLIDIPEDEHLHEVLTGARTAGSTAIDERTGAVVVLDHREVDALSHEPRLAGIGLIVFDMMGIGDTPLRRWYSQLMFTNEGAHHHRLRRLAARAFTPRSVERHRATARELADQRLESIVEAGGGDLVEAFADVPIRVICELLGVPAADVDGFIDVADALSPVFGAMDPAQIEAAEAAVVELTEAVDAMIAARTDRRGDDLISALLDAEESGDSLTHAEVVLMVGNLIVGGHDTTASQIGCSLVTLLRHPDVFAELRADSTIAPHVVNETIRFEPSITVVPRTVVEPLEIGGVERDPGTFVLLSSASANRTPDVWGDPDAFRPSRFADDTPPKVLSFGAGPHYCLGAALARMTLEETVLAGARHGLGDELVPAIDITPGGEVMWQRVLGRSPIMLPVVRRSR